MKRHLPTPEQVSRMLSDLLGTRTSTVKLPTPLPANTLRAVASYVDDAGALAYALGADLACCTSLAAALAMIPAGAVKDALRTGKLSEELFDNFSEITNVAACLFNAADADRVHLKACSPCPPPLAAELTRAMAAPSSRLALDITVQGYGPGKMMLLVFGGG